MYRAFSYNTVVIHSIFNNEKKKLNETSISTFFLHLNNFRCCIDSNGKLLRYLLVLVTYFRSYTLKSKACRQ